MDFTAVFPRFLVHDGVQDVFRGDPGVSYALVVAHHPDENIWDAVLRLDKMSQTHYVSTSINS